MDAPPPPSPLSFLKTTPQLVFTDKTSGQDGSLTVSGSARPALQEEAAALGEFSREWCELRRPGSLDLTGDPSFPRSLRGSKPRPEPSKMGKCEGRCTLLVICSLQLVSVYVLYVCVCAASTHST